MSDTYVLVHGAWHTGAELEATAEFIRKSGHKVYCPTLKGNHSDDDRSSVGLQDAVDSLVNYIEKNDLNDVRLVGHSYGGMVISVASEIITHRIKRLVYVNAFVPDPGQSLNDMVPPHYVGMFDQISSANNGAVMLPPPVWREGFINDADESLANLAYSKLNPHPYKTFTDKANLKQPMAASTIGKSYVNCVEDTAMPHSYPWHPRLSEKLGLFRYIECSGSHEVWFTNPEAIAHAIIKAGRD
jgi:pimeloyl-ACP methyl ester carboxylesterase